VPSSAKNRHHQKWSSPIVRMNPYLTAGIIGRQVHAAKSQSHSTQYLLLRRVLGARAEVWRVPLDNFRRLGYPQHLRVVHKGHARYSRCIRPRLRPARMFQRRDIISQLTQANAALSARVPELPPPPS
jgi:hypothetical protein